MTTALMPEPTGQKLMTEAITALTALGHLTPDGEPPRQDFAEIICRVLTSVAANFADVDIMLGGRAGSRQAECLRQIVTSTVSPDRLIDYRTEPIRVCMDPQITLNLIGVDDLYDLTGVYAAQADLRERVRIARYLDHPATREVAQLAVIPHPDGDDGLSDPKRAAALAVLERAERVVDEDPEVRAGQARVLAAQQRRTEIYAAWRADAFAAAQAEASRRGYSAPVIDVDDLYEIEYDLMTDLTDRIDTHLPLPGTDIVPAEVDLEDPAIRQRIAVQLTNAGLAW